MLQQYYSSILFSHLLTPTTANRISMILVPVLRCRHHKWCKCVMFNLHNSFIVKAFFLFFIKLIRVLALHIIWCWN